MPISWNEIRHNAIGFSREWAGAKSETAEKQTFWNEFFEVFGIRRRVVASFEEPVRKLSGDHGFIDLFWPRVLIVEHKSRGKNLGTAESQAYDYIRHLVSEGRQDEVPRYIIVSDFARIAEVAMWLMDHQMNIRLSEAFGQYFVRLPLRKSPTIVCGNALRLDWKLILPPEQCSYVLGNPPFVGKQFGILWKELFDQHHVKIHFAHRTFSWQSEARGKAHVHVVIVGFGAFDTAQKRIFDYEGEKATVTKARNLNPYLIEGGDIVVQSRSRPLCNVPEIVFGSMPNDGGHLILSDEEKSSLLKLEPGAAKLIRRFFGAHEFINSVRRWCLWLEWVTPSDLRAFPEVMSRVVRVKAHRAASSRAATCKLADTPTLFGEIRQPDTDYLLIPSVSSERRVSFPSASFRRASSAVISSSWFRTQPVTTSEC